MDGVKGTTRICTYDRVNLGKSDKMSDVRTSQDIVDDLHAMLTSEGIEGPYIMVGHSIGGLHVRLFAEQYPDQVVGMLLLDSTHPDNFAFYREVFPTPSPDEPSSWAQLRYSWTDADAWAYNRENFDFASSADMVRETGPFGDLPLIVLAMDPARYDAPPEIVAALARADDRIQRDLAALSTYTNGNYTIVPDAGHFIYINKPQVVIDALLELIAAARN
jgi:pimeloyl-ACP methyl ester carboxylesterase